MITQLQDGDIIDAAEVKLIHELVDSLTWIVGFYSRTQNVESEWLKNANALLQKVNGA